MKHLRDWDTKDATNYLQSLKLIQSEVTDIAIAGEGNMNCTKRVILSDGASLILKQSSPFCEKYPMIPAPIERLTAENTFYQIASRNEKLTKLTPKILNYTPQAYLMVMEDLGAGSDYSYLYTNDQKIKTEDLETVSIILSEIHATPLKSEDQFYNKSMRVLNHEHIFDLPLRKDNGIDLDAFTPGLKKEAENLINDEKFKRAVAEVGGIYLVSGDTLVHGDYYPNSWLKTDSGVFVIDPEFGFVGPKEFDLGVAKAHFLLSEQDQSVIKKFFQNYSGTYDNQLTDKFAGIEIMRRLIGVAQLPLNYDLAKKSHLLQNARALVLG